MEESGMSSSKIICVLLTVLVLPLGFNACGPAFEAAKFPSHALTSNGVGETSDLPAEPIMTPTPPPVESEIRVDRTDPKIVEASFLPATLDAGADQWNDAEFASVDTRVPSLGYVALYLFGAGTNSPAGHATGMKAIAGFGLHTVIIDYAQDYGIGTGCAIDDKTCFGKKRLEAITGADASPLINVTRSNSVEERFKRALTHLAQIQPQYGWGYFLDSAGEVRWDRVVVIGHSHGSANAAYIGKLHKLARVVMLAGPDDNIGTEPADWMRTQSQTPLENIFGFINSNEPRTPKYKISWAALGIDVSKFTDVQGGAVPTDRSVRGLHLSTDYGSESVNHSSVSPSSAATRAALMPIYRYLMVPSPGASGPTPSAP
jgi:hypothetical protein